MNNYADPKQLEGPKSCQKQNKRRKRKKAWATAVWLQSNLELLKRVIIFICRFTFSCIAQIFRLVFCVREKLLIPTWKWNHYRYFIHAASYTQCNLQKNKEKINKNSLKLFKFSQSCLKSFLRHILPLNYLGCHLCPWALESSHFGQLMGTWIFFKPHFTPKLLTGCRLCP